MSTWKTFWVYGKVNPLDNWLDNQKHSDEDGNKNFPHEFLCVGPHYPIEQTGTNEEGNPIYAKKSGNPECIWLFGLHGDKKDLIEEIRVLNGNYTIHELESIEKLRELYPDHAIGGIPYIC